MKAISYLLAISLIFAIVIVAIGTPQQTSMLDYQTNPLNEGDGPKEVGYEEPEGTRAAFEGLVVDRNIDHPTIWETEGTPYAFISVQANISVLPGINLTIMPGVTVKFSYQTSLSVNGTLIANGSKYSPINFIPLADDPGTLDWKGIFLQNDSDYNVFNFVNIEYAEGGIAIYGTDPVITNCALQYNHYYGILCGENSSPTIKESYINFTRWAGIICENISYPNLDGNHIKTFYYGIVCYDLAEVKNNDIENGFIGILCWGDANVTFNDVKDCTDGIQAFYSAPRIENNNVYSCSGNGTRFMGSGAIVKNNTLQFNDVGMDISYDAKEILENMEGNFVNGIDITTCFYVGQNNFVIDGLKVDSGYAGNFYGRLTAQGSVTLYDCHNVSFRNCNITNSQNAIYATNSSFVIYNTYFDEARKSQVYLDHNASGLAFNGSVNPDNVIIGGANCLFITYDELQVQVRDYYNEPIEGANIVIKESQLELYNITTDENGLTDKLVVKDSTVSEAGVISSPLIVQIYTDEYNFETNPLTGVRVKDTNLVIFTDLGDIFPPALVNYSVDDGDRSFPMNDTITITFNEPMNQGSVEEAFSISGNVTGTFTWNGWNLTFTPDALEYQTYYIVVISTDAKDLWDNNLQEPVSFSFTTVSAPGTSSSSNMLIAIIAIFAIAGVAGFFVLKKINSDEK